MNPDSKHANNSHNYERVDRSSDTAIAVNELAKRYGGKDGIQAIDGISFEIERGTAVGILGPNGAGKTSIIKCLLGLIIPSSGEVRVRGVDIQSEPKQAYRHIGATLEGARNMYWRLSVLENMNFFAALGGNDPRKRRDRQEQLLSQFGIKNKANTVVRELSRGEKQKISLACALARDADFLFLDEPTLGLDVESSLELRTELRRLVEDDKTTVLISSHDMDVIEEVCDRVMIINDGKIVADDTVENLLQVFNTKRYEVIVTGDMTTTTWDRLQSQFNADEFESQIDQTRFRVSVPSNGFYNLVDLLRDAELSVISFEIVEFNMEDMFLEILERKKQPQQTNRGKNIGDKSSIQPMSDNQ
jgi:ABC-2 type transport system ATP-binding protein